MSGKKQVLLQNVGCDFAKADFKACIRQRLTDQSVRIKASSKFKNTLSGFKSFIKWVNKHSDSSIEIKVTLEPTGVYHENFLYYCHKMTDYKLCLVLGNQSKAYAKSLGIYTKTDKVDAKILSQMGLERDLRSWQPSSPNMLSVKRLCRERESMQVQKTALNNRLLAAKSSHAANKQELKRIKSRLHLLTKHIKQVEKEIKAAVDSDALLSEKITNVCTMPGLSLISVATVVSEMDGFELFTNRGQVVKYAGYDVVQRESGSSIKGRTRISKRGNPHIRRVLYFPALTTVKHDENMKNLYDRIYEKGSIKMKGYVAVQRKLLLMIYTLFKKNEAYDPKYEAKKAAQKAKKSRQETSPAYAESLLME